MDERNRVGEKEQVYMRKGRSEMLTSQSSRFGATDSAGRFISGD